MHTDTPEKIKNKKEALSFLIDLNLAIELCTLDDPDTHIRQMITNRLNLPIRQYTFNKLTFIQDTKDYDSLILACKLAINYTKEI